MLHDYPRTMDALHSRLDELVARDGALMAILPDEDEMTTFIYSLSLADFRCLMTAYVLGKQEDERGGR